MKNRSTSMRCTFHDSIGDIVSSVWLSSRQYIASAHRAVTLAHIFPCWLLLCLCIDDVWILSTLIAVGFFFFSSALQLRGDELLRSETLAAVSMLKPRSETALLPRQVSALCRSAQPQLPCVLSDKVAFSAQVSDRYEATCRIEQEK